MFTGFESSPDGLSGNGITLPYWRGFARRLDPYSLSAYIVSMYYRVLGHGWGDLKYLTPTVVKDLTGTSDRIDLVLEYPSVFSYQTRADIGIYSPDGVLCEIGIRDPIIYLYTQTELYTTRLTDTSTYIELPAKVCYLLCSAGIELTERCATVFPSRKGHVVPYKSNSAFILPIYTLPQLLDFLVLL